MLNNMEIRLLIVNTMSSKVAFAIGGKRNLCCCKVVNPVELIMGNNHSFHK
jgi:hypothetical protein